MLKQKKLYKRAAAILLSAAMVIAGQSGNVGIYAKAKPKLNKKKVTLKVGKKVRLKLKHAKKKVTWKSTKKKVASVSKKGVVKAKKKGTAKIIARSAGKKYTCKVTVKAKGNSFTDDEPMDSLAPSSAVGLEGTASPSPAPGGTSTPNASSTPGSTANASISPVPSASIQPTVGATQGSQPSIRPSASVSGSPDVRIQTSGRPSEGGASNVPTNPGSTSGNGSGNPVNPSNAPISWDPARGTTVPVPGNPTTGTTAPMPGNPTGGTAAPNPENPGGGTVNPDPENPGGGTVNPNPENPTVGTTAPNPEDPAAETTTPNPEDPAAETTAPNPEDPAAETTAPDPEDPTVETTAPDPENPTIETTAPNPVNPSEETTAPDSGDEEVEEGDCILAEQSEGLTITTGSDSVYSFKIGNTKEQITKAFGTPRRVDPQPQGFDSYVYWETDGGDIDVGSYFQVYIQGDEVIGGATMADQFSYKDLVERDTEISSGWNSLSRYKYTDSKYTTDGNAFVFAYVDSFGTNRIYGVRFITNSITLDDLMMPSNIVQKNNSAFSAYTANTGSASVQNPISLELEEWARAYRRYSFNNSDTGKSKMKFMEQAGENEAGMPKLAQIHSTYNAINKKYEGAEEASTDEITALNALLGVSEIDSSIDTRFKYGYFDTLNAMKRYMYAPQGDVLTSCYTLGEMNGTNRPDAIGYLTWWVEGGEDKVETYRDCLTVTASKNNDNIALDPSTFHIVGGFSYGGDTQNYTYATLDMFSMQ